MKNPLPLIAVFAGLAAIFFGITRFAYLPNNFFQRNHILLGLICLSIATVIFALNYKPGKKN